MLQELIGKVEVDTFVGLTEALCILEDAVLAILV